MSAQRRRDPRIPGESILEDVEVVLDGETVSSRDLTLADSVIVAANQEELERRRMMWGLDRDAWLLPIQRLTEDGELEAAKALARQWCAVSLTLGQYDTREPDLTGWLMLANLHHQDGDHAAERVVLERWLENWPRPTEPIWHRVAARVGRDC